MPGWENTPPSTGLGEHVQGVINDARGYAVKQDEIGLRRQELERQTEQMKMTRQQHQIEMGQKVMEDWKNVAENSLSPKIQKAYLAKLQRGYLQMGWQWDDVMAASMQDPKGVAEFLRAYSKINSLPPAQRGEVFVNGSSFLKEGQLFEGMKQINAFDEKQTEIKASGDQTVRNTKVAGEEARKTEAMKEENARKKEPLFPKLTPGEEQTDKDFSKTYNEFVTAGGASEVKKSLEQLRQVKDKLVTRPDSVTGFVKGSVPDFLGTLTNPEAVDARQTVEQIITKGLRQVFGPQFTEKEGEKFMARSYDARLPAATNKARLQNAIQQLEGAASAKIAASQYYEAMGTLRGYKGTVVNSVSDLLKAPVAGPPEASAAPPPPKYAPALVGGLKKMKALKWSKEKAEQKLGYPIPPDLAKQVGY